ncbi:lethal(2)neighbour of tid protein [Eurytemora carolleeae]|uniref:lethal(2)neighbour of tid protein n=1 Tax=Eurytemora carolleeae TaxID=1294199 RepID=UPI000C784AD3|nr:lethal(2)neighbour of tid protein [Eurytemora carolleeae]|eukprot:XP_023322007.1 lethal(2)neighbour of tid protein-like [Eurytemora affinis]
MYKTDELSQFFQSSKMAAPGRSRKKSAKPFFAGLISGVNSYSDLKKLFLDPEYAYLAAGVLIIIEIVINIIVINKVKYTEIDWIAYMQEVEGVKNGTYDYSQLKGDTGPLVYPGGFVWIYMILYFITSQGKNVLLAQYIFCVLYVVNLALIFRILVKTRKIPPYLYVIMSLTSYRIHSVFVLRLFNDPVAVLLVYAAVNLFLDNHWTLGSLMYSLAVSVKMNILLYSPALLIAYITVLGYKQTFFQLSVCAGFQVLVGLPFLLHHPLNYIIGAFNLGRVFMYKWTVNFRFLPEEVFVNRYFHISLLLLHIVVLAAAARYMWRFLSSYSKLRTMNIPAVAQLLVLPFFLSNFIGVMFARSLHYQFYVWYYHTLPYLAWCSGYRVMTRLLILGVVEMCWNIYPSTVYSSLGLHCCHLVLFYGVLKNMIKQCNSSILTVKDRGE